MSNGEGLDTEESGVEKIVKISVRNKIKQKTQDKP